MKFFVTLLLTFYSFVIAGCSGDNNSHDQGELLFDEHRYEDNTFSMVFPVSDYIAYKENTDTIAYPLALDSDFPQGFIYEATTRFGHINAAEENLPYMDQKTRFSGAVDDFALFDEQVYGVSGKFLTQYSEGEDAWVLQNQWFLSRANFTEVTAQDTDNLWLIDSENHRLYHFHVSTNRWNYWSLPGSVDAWDIKFHENHLLLFVSTDNQNLVATFELNIAGNVSEPELLVMRPLADHENGSIFNDAMPLPDGRILFAFESENSNLQIFARNTLPDQAPLENIENLIHEKDYSLPADIHQVSGMSPGPNNTWLLVTDQAELFQLSRDFSSVLYDQKLSFETLDCNQGCVEGITQSANDQWLILNESAVLLAIQFRENTFEVSNEIVLDLEGEYSGLAFRSEPENEGAYLYLINDSNNANNQDQLCRFESLQYFSSRYCVDLFTASGSNINWYNAEGLSFNGDFIYVASQAWQHILKVSLNGEIVQGYQFEHPAIDELSDLYIDPVSEQFYFLGDHENGEAVPPISVFRLPPQD